MTDIRPEQLDLGELIATLEADLAKNGDRTIPIGFHNPHSWRGDYTDLAFEPTVNILVSEMLAAAQSALGTTYQGWKGGDYTMTKHTACWLSTYGYSNAETLGVIGLRLMLHARGA